MEPPDLGVGVIWFAGLDRMIEAHQDLVDFYEIEPATLSLSVGEEVAAHANGPLARLQSHGKPVVVHGVSCPVGGTVPVNAAEIAALAGASDFVDAPWVSEHLSIDRLTDRSGTVIPTGFFLPPAQSFEAVELAADRLQRLKVATGRAVAFETGVSYLQPMPGELSDGEFFAAVAKAADCYILCDLHNLWCNEQNGRQPMVEVLEQLPLERICEVHLAGGQDYNGFLLDAHSNLVDPALAQRAAGIIERLPSLRAITFELIPDYVAPNGIDSKAYRRQLEQLHRLWEARGRRAGCQPRSPARRTCTSQLALAPAAWEQALGSALTGNPSPLTDDRGIEVYKHLIATIRAGAIVTAMPLSYRLLALSLGPAGADQVLEAYRYSVPPAAWARDEAHAFGNFLAERVDNVPRLGEVAAFELAALEALATGHPHNVRFTCEPRALLDPLRRGVAPPANLPPGNFEVTVDP